jgi:cyclopropane fatty-acyl-phospholipid synthase-like methyltransferase
VLDFGSGIGHLANDFPAADYLGIEPLEKCVAFAKKRYGRENADFIVGDHYSLANLSNESFDLIIAIGVLHHMDDQSVKDFIKHSYRILVKGGRIVTFDPVFHKNQSILSRFVVSQDRGLWVRTPEQYINLFEEMITSALSSSIYSKLLRIPYDHFAITATKSD